MNIQAYGKDIILRFIPTYTVVLVLAFLVENSRSKTICKLRVHEADLSESKDLLEQRVIERTTELEYANQLLKKEVEERRRAEKERLQLEEELLRAQHMESLGRLAGGVAHDLNNVLSGIVSYPDLLLLDLSPDDKMYTPLKNIRSAGQRSAAIVQDLLTMARRGIKIKKNVLISDLIQSISAVQTTCYSAETTLIFSLKNNLNPA